MNVAADRLGQLDCTYPVDILVGIDVLVALVGIDSSCRVCPVSLVTNERARAKNDDLSPLRGCVPFPEGGLVRDASELTEAILFCVADADNPRFTNVCLHVRLRADDQDVRPNIAGGLLLPAPIPGREVIRRVCALLPAS